MKQPADESNNTPNKGLSLDEAFAQLKANRSSQTPDDDQEHIETDDADVVEDSDELEEEEFDSEEDEEESDDSDDDDQDEDEEDAEESEEDEGEDDVWEIEIDGETVEVSTDELHKGYLRHNDYTRKRQADAKKAKDLETEYQGKLEQLNNALANNVSQDERTLQDLNQKYHASTDDAAKRSIHYQMLQIQQNVQARKNALDQASALQQQATSAEKEAYWNEQEELLNAKYENWDEKKVELSTYLNSQGFEDLSMFAHANMADIVDKARQFDDLQQKRKSVAKKKIKRKVPKVLKAGQGEKKFNLDRKVIKDLEARFAKTGNIKDAQALMRAKRGNK